MDIESLYYFMETAKDMHITETAERLYMSQQTLSNHIQRVEEHYNVVLFNRKPRLQLTPTGREVLRFAETVFNEERNLKNYLTDVIENDYDELYVGASSPRYNFYLPPVLSKFSERFPNVTINLRDNRSTDLERLVQKNELDFAVCVNSAIEKLNLAVESVYADPIYLCVSDRLLVKCYGEEEAKRIKRRSVSGADLRDFRDVPIMKTSMTNRLGLEISSCFALADYTPKVYLETNSTTMLVPLCNTALCAGFTSHMNLALWKPQLDDDVNIIPLRKGQDIAHCSIYLVRHKQRYLNHHAKYLIHLIEAYFKQIEKESITRIVGI